MPLYSQVPGELDIEISIRDGLALPIQFASGTFSAAYTYAAAVIKAGLETETPIIVSGTGSYYDQLTLYLSNSSIQTLEANKHKWYLVWTNNLTSMPREGLAGYFEIKPFPYP
jgi:hypothetical protein